MERKNLKEKKSKSLSMGIFWSSFLSGALVYLVCSFLFILNMYSYFERQIFDELESEASLILDYTLEGKTDSLSKLKIKNRITLINSDGTVYFDNTIDPSTMENHYKRIEFIGAQQDGTYKSTRFSTTMTEKTLYYARLLDNGDVLRVSSSQHTIGVLIFGMSPVLGLMLVIAMIISAMSANWTSKKIVQPLNRIDLLYPEKADVYQELKPLTKRLSEENYEKSQREELRKQFTANVSHELKTPLTSISGFAEILKAGGTDEKTTVDFANTIYKESQRLISLVNDIIKLSKLDEESISLEKEDLSLRDITKDVFSMLTESAKKKNVLLNLYGDSGNIKGVSPVIYEMIYNLTDNAIKYNKENGSVDITIKTENLCDAKDADFVANEIISYEEPSDRTADKNKKCVMVTVSDTGIGIPGKEKDRIFERFYRIDQSRSKELGGTGLGLSIVKHGAKYHDASIALKSQEGKGSTFMIIFNA